MPRPLKVGAFTGFGSGFCTVQSKMARAPSMYLNLAKRPYLVQWAWANGLRRYLVGCWCNDRIGLVSGNAGSRLSRERLRESQAGDYRGNCAHDAIHVGAC
jgi:hypothetical protein